MSLKADERSEERVEQWERGYDAALREAVMVVNGLPRTGEGALRPERVVAVLEAMRHD